MPKQTKRTCTAKTKTGKRCRATPLKDTNRCLAHADEETRAKAGFGGSRAGKLGGRPPLPKPTELARQLVERNIAAILRPHFKALGLLLNDDGSIEPLDRGAIITGESKDGEVIASTIEDLAAQIAAAEKLLDRVYGRPKQTQELTGAEGGPIDLVAVTQGAEHTGRVLKLLAGTGAVREGA